MTQRDERHNQELDLELVFINTKEPTNKVEFKEKRVHGHVRRNAPGTGIGKKRITSDISSERRSSTSGTSTARRGSAPGIHEERRGITSGNNAERRRTTSDTSAEKRRLAKIRRRKKIMRRRIILLAEVTVVFVLIVVAIWFLRKPQEEVGNEAEDQEVQEVMNPLSGLMVQGIPAEVYAIRPHWNEEFLTISDHARPGDAIGTVKNIFVHYTANPGTSAAQNRSYFENDSTRSVSSHFIIGYEGEIIQCVPLDEIAYAVVGRNEDSISIECCFIAEDGSFTQETYDSLISLLSWLMKVYGLNENDILRHYDCGGKLCPIYYVENEREWQKLKSDVAADRESY